MCGIIGYVGKRQAAPLLIEGLKRLEYRGYDSAGLAVIDKVPQLKKAVGKIVNLESQLKGSEVRGCLGIAHTRWATHGRPSDSNTHPHTDCRGEIFLVHNGIIENYQRLKQKLAAAGHTFSSETDSEVVAHLIEEYYRGNLEEAVSKALSVIEGAFGLAVVHSRHQDQIVLARRSSPLVIGIGCDEMFVASDVSAFIEHTKRVVYLDDNEVATVCPSFFTIRTPSNGLVKKPVETIDWDIAAAERNGYPHFMLKEIFEQPEAVRNAQRGRINKSVATAKLGGLESVFDELTAADRMIMVSCGTSYYASLLGRYMFEELTDCVVDVDLASEFRNRRLNLKPGTVVLAISQSGETADTLAAVRLAKQCGALTLGLVNVVGSSISRETHAGVYNHAGPEIAVASTKSFVSQATILALIALMLGRAKGLSRSAGQKIIAGLEKLPEQLEQVLSSSGQIKALAEKYARFRNFLYLGRKFNYPVAMEGALKLKEVSYLHAEGYAAGEMKHGPIALIDEDFPSVCIATRDSSYQKMLNNIEEVKARGGRVIAVANEGDREVAKLADDLIYIPRNIELLMPIAAVVPLQLFAYYIAAFNGCDIDKPRNLAKSVTVE